jgi:putative ABC transport system permease protein
MIRTRTRKILRDVWARKGRTVLVAASIMIGVFGAVTLISVNDLIVRQIEEDINPDEIAMTRLFVTVPTVGTELNNEGYLDALRSMPGVTEVQGMLVAPIFWRKAGEEGFTDDNMVAYSEPFGEIKLEGMRLVEGDWPQPGQHQIAVERRLADAEDLKINDTLQFRTLNASGETAVSEWTISGITFQPYWIESPQGEVEAEERIYAYFEDAQQIAGVSGFSLIYLRYIDTQTAWDAADRLETFVADHTGYIPLGTWLDDPENYFLIDEVKEVTNILNILAIVALVVSGFLVTNVINTIVVEQKRQIGVMKSLGATRWDNFTLYAGVALIYGILGTIPGVILGIIAGSAMATALAPLAATLIDGFKISTVGVLIGAAMGLFVPVIASILPVFNGTRVTIREAMTDLGIAGNWGRGVFARLIKALPVPINIKQALSNVVQKKGRLALTVITLTLAASAFMGVFAMFTVVQDEIDKLYNTFNFEAVVVPSEPQDYEQVRGLLMGVGGVEAVHPAVSFTVKFIDLGETVMGVQTRSEFEIEATGIDPASGSVDITYESGTGWDEDPNRAGIVLTTPAAELMDKKVGDHAVISAGGHTGEFEVIGIASYPFEMALMQWQELARLTGFVTSDNGTPRDTSDDTPLPRVFLVKLADEEVTAREVDDFVNRFSEVLLANGISATYGNEVREQEEEAEGFVTFNMIFQLTSAVMAAVGAIGLLTTLSMAVFERQKEIGVMRSIGAKSSTIITQFLVEGLLIGLIAWLIAIPLSYGLALILLDGLGFADFFDFKYPLWVTGLGLAGMLVVAAIASLWPSISASRRTVSDILRYQ